MINRNQIYSVIDLGSTKTAVAIGTLEDGHLEILGLGKAENRGLKQGQIVNMEATEKSIQSAKEQAELMAGFKITEAHLVVGGEGIQCQKTLGMVPVKGDVVSKEDIANVLQVAQAIHIPEMLEVLHTLPIHYCIDGQSHITHPEGMHGVRLEVEAQLVTLPKKNLQNAKACARKVGVSVVGSVLLPMASAEAVVRQDEKELGVAVCDMGGGTFNLIVYREGVIDCIGTIPVGGLNFTQDVAVGLKTPLNYAESVKVKHGNAIADHVESELEIPIESLGDGGEKMGSSVELAKILEARAEETLSLILQQLQEWGVASELGAGMILTGGASQLKGFVELAEFAFDFPVRQGLPTKGKDKQPESPFFSTALGALQLLVKDHQPKIEGNRSKPKKVTIDMANSMSRIKSMFEKTFSI